MAAKKRTNTADPGRFAPDEVNYTNNMQFIQNTMGMYTQIYESICLLNTHVDWSEPEVTMNVVKGTIASAVVMAFAYPYIRWNYIVLAGGWALVGGNTAFGQASVALVVDYIQSQFIPAAVAID